MNWIKMHFIPLTRQFSQKAFMKYEQQIFSVYNLWKEVIYN